MKNCFHEEFIYEHFHKIHLKKAISEKKKIFWEIFKRGLNRNNSKNLTRKHFQISHDMESIFCLDDFGKYCISFCKGFTSGTLRKKISPLPRINR